MAESSRPQSKRKKTTSETSEPCRSALSRRCPPTSASPSPTMGSNPSFSSSRASSYSSSLAQQKRYFDFFQSRDILDPKFLDRDFFDNENFECYEVFRNYDLLDFMTIKRHYYLDLVRLFYCNLKITDGCLRSEVKKIPIIIDQNLFYDITKLRSDGELFEGTIVDSWKDDYSNIDARKMISNDGPDITGRLLAGSLNFDCRIMHYIIAQILHPRFTNLAQLTEEDIILIWALLTSRQIDWAHLVRYRMQKALRANAPLLYAHLITVILEHFNVPLEDEHFVIVHRSYSIGAGAICSFGYKKNLQRQWVHKRVYQAETQAERTPSLPSNLASNASSSSMTDLLSELRGLRVYVGERFDALDSCMTRLEGDIVSIHRHLGIHHDSVAEDAP